MRGGPIRAAASYGAAARRVDGMDAVAVAPRGQQGRQRRVGFVSGKLLGVSVDEVRMSKKHQCPDPTFGLSELVGRGGLNGSNRQSNSTRR